MFCSSVHFGYCSNISFIFPNHAQHFLLAPSPVAPAKRNRIKLALVAVVVVVFVHGL